MEAASIHGGRERSGSLSVSIRAIRWPILLCLLLTGAGCATHGPAPRFADPAFSYTTH